MSAPLGKLRFHIALYAAYLGIRRGRFGEISKAPLAANEALPEKLKAFFWTPADTAGANAIVHDMLPSLTRLARERAPGWKIQAGASLPEQPVDWLIAFKAVPDPARVGGQPRQVLLICDQAEVFWDRLREFDAIVATSSRPFASLLATKHRRVTFISESEPPDYLAFGKKNLATPPAARRNVLLWHGGYYSQDALIELRPELIKWAEQPEAQLHVVSGQAGLRVEKWGALTVNFFPWSKAQLQRSAAVARLGFVPARFSLKKNWLKPASRVRCLYALGVPAIGDDRVPDVADFMAAFNGPLAGRSRRWLVVLTELWNDGAGLARFAASGHAVVAEKFSTEQTARQWLRYLAQSNKP
jgi:hypothetical protein